MKIKQKIAKFLVREPELVYVTLITCFIMFGIVLAVVMQCITDVINYVVWGIN